MSWNRMGWDGMGWDSPIVSFGMGWDGMGLSQVYHPNTVSMSILSHCTIWDGMGLSHSGWDGMGWDYPKCTTPTQSLLSILSHCTIRDGMGLSQVYHPNTVSTVHPDDACHLRRFARNPVCSQLTKQTKQIAATEMVVDKIHMKGHIDPCRDGSRTLERGVLINKCA